MKSTFSIYLKSYRNDVIRAFELLKSIEQYNIEKIPFYISVPSEDRKIFKNTLGTDGYDLIEDEDIFYTNKSYKNIKLHEISGNLSQQIVKSEFWRLNISTTYLCLDSDSVFLRNFTKSNFFNENEKIYTVAHNANELLQQAKQYGKEKVIKNFLNESNNLKSYFTREGADYDFGPSPYLWHRDVWEWLSNYLYDKELNFVDAIKLYGTEDRWYGESLIKSKVIDFIPTKQLFKVYHYKWQYKNDLKKNISIEEIKKEYIGIIHQSNWDKRLDSRYVKKKNILSRIVKAIKFF